jgi:hypothetical protein
MPSYSDSTSTAKMPPAMARTSSQQSASRGSPGGGMANKTKQHKGHHPVGRTHTRTPSYGKGLHKLTKLTGNDEDGHAKSGKKGQTPSTSPSTTHVKRNSSTVSLPRVGSKVSIKKNKSDVSLKKNASTTHVNRSRPTTPIRKNDSHGSGLDKLKRKSQPQFTVEADDEDEDDDQEEEEEEDDDDDDEWTEDSTSPNITRQSSISKGSRTQSRRSSPPPPPLTSQDHAQNGNTLPDSPPDSPTEHPTRAGIRETAQIQLQAHRESRPLTLNPDALTSRLLSGQTIAPENDNVMMVNGGRQAHTPPSHPDSTPYPANGISRFLGTSSSTVAVSQFSSPGRPTNPTGTTPITRSPSPNPPVTNMADLRKSASAGNLLSSKRTPLVTKDPEPSNSKLPPSYTFTRQGKPSSGTNTQNKLDLWRLQGNVEPSEGPPAPLMKGAPVGLLGTEERRARLWEGAEHEMAALRRFVNPVLDSVKRAQTKSKKLKSDQKLLTNGIHGRDHASSNESRLSTSTGTSSETTGTNGANTTSSKRTTVVDTGRPTSRTGPRSVRFEVGVDESARDNDGNEALEELLRRIWAGNEAEAVEG